MLSAQSCQPKCHSPVSRMCCWPPRMTCCWPPRMTCCLHLHLMVTASSPLRCPCQHPVRTRLLHPLSGSPWMVRFDIYLIFWNTRRRIGNTLGHFHHLLGQILPEKHYKLVLSWNFPLMHRLFPSLRP